MPDVGGTPVQVRRPLSSRDLPLLRAYVEAEVALQVAGTEVGADGQGRSLVAERRTRDEAWANLQAGA